MSTKEKILDAALALFAENGYDGTSVEWIAGSVGYKGSFFAYSYVIVLALSKNDT